MGSDLTATARANPDRMLAAQAFDGPTTSTSRISHLGPEHDHTVTGTLEYTLDRLDGAVNYADWVGDRLAPFISGDVVEIGAGSGTLTERLRGGSKSLVAVEPYPVLGASLAERFQDEPEVSVVIGDLQAVDPELRFDTAVLVNVLEHIEDDIATMRDVHSRLRPGGRIVLFVPAFESLYSQFDRQIGHHRRYTKADLNRKLAAAGFEIEESRYFNAVGFMLWFFGVRMLRRSPAQSRVTLPFDKHGVPILRKLESDFRPPFGQSLVGVGLKR